MMVNTLTAWGQVLPTQGREAGLHEAPDLVDWLRSGRLTLVDRDRNPVTPEGWSELPADVRAQVLADFRRIVGSNAKAAVLFVR